MLQFVAKYLWIIKIMSLFAIEFIVVWEQWKAKVLENGTLAVLQFKIVCFLQFHSIF